MSWLTTIAFLGVVMYLFGEKCNTFFRYVVSVGIMVVLLFVLLHI